MKASITIFLNSLQFLITLSDDFHPKRVNRNLPINQMESSQEFWIQKAQNFLASQVSLKVNTNKAKNIILFLGDGMSLANIAATRMHIGTEQSQLSFEKFPHFGLSRTYCVNLQTADSACTATAYLSGVKANGQTMGLNANVLRNQCNVRKDDHTESIASWAQRAKKATGIVTTTRITHASPAGVYAHVPNRDWEDDTDTSKDCPNRNETNVEDIAYQLVHNEVSKKLKVMLGGGRRHFLNNTVVDDEGSPGRRSDGKNLISEWLAERNKNAKAKYIWHKQQLDEVDIEETDFLLGLFESSHCLYNLDIDNNNLHHQEPSLTDMTAAAIKMLQKEVNGFFLFVEGGRIDHAHHDNLPYKALEETKEFARAIDIARQMTSEEDTLIVVTSDHSHAFTYGGSSNRGDDILGFGTSDVNHKPVLTLAYANGPGYNSTFDEKFTGLRDLTNIDLHNPSFMHSAFIPLKSETHAGEDVGVFSSGPYSHLLIGSFEQNTIPVLMAYAAKIGPFEKESSKAPQTPKLSLCLFVSMFVMSVLQTL